MHDLFARNNAGIRMPTDFYAIREYYNVYGIPDEKGFLRVQPEMLSIGVFEWRWGY